MTEAEVVRLMREHLEGLFPRNCPGCRRHFPNLREYLLATEHLGPAIPHDVELGDWTPLRPIGVATYANCACGTTLSLTSAGISLPVLWSLLAWARRESHRRHLAPRELLNYLRDEICKQMLAPTLAEAPTRP